jgi:hypothetical protein
MKQEIKHKPWYKTLFYQLTGILLVVLILFGVSMLDGGRDIDTIVLAIVTLMFSAALIHASFKGELRGKK